jgi:sec-independent protein translocase protein TatC
MADPDSNNPGASDADSPPHEGGLLGFLSGSRGDAAGDGEGARMGFMDHLMELRRRLWIVAVTLLVCIMAAIFYSTELFGILRYPAEMLNQEYAADAKAQADQTHPLLRGSLLGSWTSLPKPAQGPDSRPLLFIQKALDKLDVPPDETPVVHIMSMDPLDTIMMMMWIGVWAGVVLSAPIMLYQLWAFVAPGLRNREKRAIRPVLYGGIFFFLIGCAVAYFVLFPVCIRFFVWLNTVWHIDTNWKIDAYVSLLINMMFLTGLVCEIPLVVAVLAKLRIVRPRHLLVFWRPIILAAFVLGAVLSPGTDVMSMLVFTAMLLSIYFASILMALIFYRAEPSGQHG